MADVAVPSVPALSAVRRVELIHTGEWQISNGPWRASRDDLVAAVAALDCPAVRRPVLKLGHSKGEAPLWAGNPTGAPAVGWVDNLALTNSGHTLVGDFVGMPGWLGDIAASAYPDRSVEGSYDFRCQIGHTHPFVLTAVALLGVTPPGVGTLRSLQDVGALYGVTDSSATGTTAPVEAAAEVRTGAMVALLPSEDDIARLAVGGGEDAAQLHVTLFHLGKAADFDASAREEIIGAVRELAAVIPPGQVDAFAVAAFNPTNPDRDTAIVLELGGDGLEDVHGLVEDVIKDLAAEAGIDLPEQHTPWRPHVTLAYTDDLTKVVEWADRTGPVRIDRIRVAYAGENVDIPLTGEGIDDPALDDITDDDMPVEAAAEVDAQQSRRITRSDRALRRYWLRGAGAVKIGWNTPGDWTRCVRLTSRYLRDPRGYCARLHREATGVYPGDRRNAGRRNASVDVQARFDPTQLRDHHGRWVDTMHPATPGEIADFRARFGQAIPPAWADVHIADDLDNAPLLVTGSDAKGRRQSIYSAAHTDGQAAKKFQRIQELNKHLDKLDHAVERDASVNDDAAALLLIRRLGMRPGSARDTQASTQAYGATTLEARHVTVDGGTARLDFTGKKGVHIQLETSDPVVVEALSRRLETRSGDERLFNTTEARTRDYMRSTGVPDGFLLKDLRTVLANVTALREIQARDGVPSSRREFQSWRRQVATVVSAALGNTPAVALSSYINPTVWSQWIRDPGWVDATAKGSARDEEKRLLAAWFSSVNWDEPETGIPAVEPDPDDEDNEDNDGVEAALQASAEEEMTLPNPNPTIVHAAARISVDDVRAAYYQHAPQHAWIREFHQRPLRLIVANDADGTVARVDVTISDDGQITFGAPVPVRVEYVEESAGQVTASRTVYASAAESRPDVQAHMRGRHDQSTHGRRLGKPGNPTSGPSGPSGADAAIRNAYDSLVRGKGASIDASELDELLRTLTGGGDEAKRANLAHLNVGGYGTLFATDKSGALDRSKMPQLGTNEEEMRPFLDVLKTNGVSVKIAEIDPTTLKPSQSEISGAKTGKLAGFMAKDGWLPGGLLVTSNDGYVVDGHHRWSGAAAVRASGERPDMTVTGLIVDRPIDEVLQLAASVARFESLEFDRTAQASVAHPHKPPAAEPDQPTTEEDEMSLTEVRRRLGLADDADHTAVLAAIDDLQEEAGDARQVAAAAAENKTLSHKVGLLEEQVASLSQEIAAGNAAKAADVKASVIDGAVRQGRIKPADRETWGQRYDTAPQVVTDVLASIAPGTAVPVTAAGVAGTTEPVAASTDTFDEALAAGWASELGIPLEEMSRA